MQSQIHWESQIDIAELSSNTPIIKNLATLINISPDAIQQALILRSSAQSDAVTVERKSGVSQVLEFPYWYNQFSSEKSSWDYRTINEPAPALKIVQRRILDSVLYSIPTHVWTYWWKKDKSFVDNARAHRDNHPRYLVQTDIRSAFPSVDSTRIHNVLSATVGKSIDISFPSLSDSQREDMINMFVTLVSLDNELPQWAPSSPRILDIVMAKSDQEISQYLSEWDITLFSPLYTRYVDDINISWKEFADMNEVWKVRTKILSILQQASEKDDFFNSDSIVSYVQLLDSHIWEIEELQYVVNNNKQKKFIITLLKDISQKLLFFKEYSDSNSSPEISTQIDVLQTRIADLRHSVEQTPLSNQTQRVLKEIEKILYGEGWEVNTTKRRIWTPTSSDKKVITWVSIDDSGNLWIPHKKQTEIETFLGKAVHNPELLPTKLQTRPDIIIATILGYRNYVIQVRGTWLGNLAALFRKAEEKYKISSEYSNTWVSYSEVWF